MTRPRNTPASDGQKEKTMEAPERIWASNDLHRGYSYIAKGPQPHFSGEEYIRANASQAAIDAAVKAERDRCAMVADDLAREFFIGGSPTARSVLELASSRIRKDQSNG